MAPVQANILFIACTLLMDMGHATQGSEPGERYIERGQASRSQQISVLQDTISDPAWHTQSPTNAPSTDIGYDTALRVLSPVEAASEAPSGSEAPDGYASSFQGSPTDASGKHSSQRAVHALACPGAGPVPPVLATQEPLENVRPVSGGYGILPLMPFVNISEIDFLPVPDIDDIPSPSVPSVAPGAKPAVCPENPPMQSFDTDTAMHNTCRAYLYANERRSRWVMCTAWFVSPEHVALAGHCVTKGGTGQYNLVEVDGRFGTVCCRTENKTGPDNCKAGYGFDVVGGVTTCGWFFHDLFSNDGAVLKVKRPSNVPANVGVPLVYGQANPFCTNEQVTYAGYPARSTRKEGCNKRWGERFHYIRTSGLAQCTTSINKQSFTWYGSSCGGMSGGPLCTNTTCIGILSASISECVGGKSVVSFAAISDSNQNWGVNIAGLVSALS